jgi:phosphoglycerate dehydrogenase-like enzyme
MTADKKRVLLVYAGTLLAPWEFLNEIAEVEYIPERVTLSPEFLRELKPHVIAGTGFEKVSDRFAITGEFMDACENLELIQLFNIGYDIIDVKAANARGVVVCNLGGVGVSSQSVAELAWAHILALARRIPQADAGMRSGELLHLSRFRANSDADLRYFRGGPVLSGKTLGVIGLGRIGKRSALIGRLGFNMRVLAYDPYLEPADADMIGVTLVELDTLLREADVVTIHTALTDDSAGLIRERELALMKPTAILVNDARGSVIDMPALARALEDGKLYGAGIDVWPVEPPDANEWWVQSLLKSRRTSLSCHIGSQYEAMVERHRAGLENVARVCRADTPAWIVNGSR